MGRLALLSRLYSWGKTGKYKPGKKESRQLKKHNTCQPSGSMAGRHRQTQAVGDVGPPQKKRKTEAEEADEELWDDSMEFTQVDLEDLDREIQASQAITSKKVEDLPTAPHSFLHPSTSTGHATHPLARSSSHLDQPQSHDTSGMFLKPQLSRSASSSSSSLNSSHVTSHNSSGHNSSSYSSSRSIHSSYPSSFNTSHSSSTSIRSGSSSDNGFPSRLSVGSGSLGSLARGVTTESLDELGILGQAVDQGQVVVHAAESRPGTSGNKGQSPERYKREKELKQQLEKLQEEVCVKEGENRLLRDNLSRRDAEIDQLKMEKISQINTQHKQQSLKEKNLQNELSKLQTQLQFKVQEEREMADKCRELETQLKQLQPIASSSQVSPTTQVNPQPRRVPVDDWSPKGSTTFPTTQSFLASEAVSPVRKRPVRDTEVNLANVAVNTDSPTPFDAPPVTEPPLKLTVTNSRQGGSQLVARLLEASSNMTGSLGERGIVALLNTPSTSASLFSVKFDRDHETSLLSPVTNKRLSEFRTLISQYDHRETVGLTQPEHFNMAVRGLTSLLNYCPRGPTVDSQGTQPSTSQGRQSTDTEPQSDYVFGSSELDSAILILPLINDYLQHYIEMVSSSMESNNNSSVTTSSKSSSSGSFDTSSESPTGSLGDMLRTTANYANNLEGLAIASLQTLNLLVTCEATRFVLLRNSDMETVANNPVARDRQGTSGRMQQFPLKTIFKCNLLRGVIRLANPGSKGHLYNTRIVETSLSILEVLAEQAQTSQITRLLPVISEEGLQNCLETETEPTIVINALHVLKALARSNLVVSSLCTNTTGCVLMSVYGLCGVDKCLTAMDVHAKLHVLHLVLELLSSIASCHKGGLTVLLESDCQCSVEVVKTIVCILHIVLKIHNENKMCDWTPVYTQSGAPVSQPQRIDSLGRGTLYESSLSLLRNGLLLLHLMYQHDAQFTSRHMAVQHQYVQLICRLAHIFKPMDNNEAEMNALQDLWDYLQDDSELYHSDDENRSMDTSQ